MNTILNAAASKFHLSSEEISDLQSTKDIYDILSSNSIYNLDQTSIDILDSIANSPDGLYAKKTVQNLLTLLGRHYPPTYIINSGELGFRSTKKKDSTFHNQIRVFPNPAKDYVTFDFTDMKLQLPGDLEIFSQIGEKVWSEIIANSQELTTINTTLYPSGFYLCTLRLSTGEIIDSKVFIIDK